MASAETVRLLVGRDGDAIPPPRRWLGLVLTAIGVVALIALGCIVVVASSPSSQSPLLGDAPLEMPTPRKPTAVRDTKFNFIWNAATKEVGLSTRRNYWCSPRRPPRFKPLFLELSGIPAWSESL